MLFGYLIDFICNMVLGMLAVGVVAFIVFVIVVIVGEKKKWW